MCQCSKGCMLFVCLCMGVFMCGRATSVSGKGVLCPLQHTRFERRVAQHMALADTQQQSADCSNFHFLLTASLPSSVLSRLFARTKPCPRRASAQIRSVSAQLNLSRRAFAPRAQSRSSGYHVATFSRSAMRAPSRRTCLTPRWPAAIADARPHAWMTTTTNVPTLRVMQPRVAASRPGRAMRALR